MLDRNDRTIAERSPLPGIAPSRDLTADAIRGIAIVLVVFGHVNRGMIEAGGRAAPALLKRIDFVIYTTHMPAFFLLAGFYAGTALARHGRRDYATARGWAVVYPYLLWSLIYWTIKVFAAGYVHHGLAMTDAARILIDPISIYWFLYALLLLQLAAAASYPHTRLLLGVMIALAAAQAAWGPDRGIIAQTLMHAPYFCAGLVLAGTRWIWAKPGLARTPVLAGIAALFAAGCAMALASGAIDPVSPLTTPLSLLGIALIIGVATLVRSTPAGRHLAWLGALSMPIYLTHIIPLSLVARGFDWLKVDAAPLRYAVQTAGGVYLPVLFYYLCQRAGIAGVLGLTAKPPFATPRKPAPTDANARAPLRPMSSLPDRPDR